MMRIEEKAGERLPAAEHWRDLARRCDRAALLLERQPDEAALLLDGLLYHILREWERDQRLPAASPEVMLVRIERAAPLVGWRMRLALRAPDARARLAACRALIEALSE
jgi:hypothetical protein